MKPICYFFNLFFCRSQVDIRCVEILWNDSKLLLEVNNCIMYEQLTYGTCAIVFEFNALDNKGFVH